MFVSTPLNEWVYYKNRTLSEAEEAHTCFVSVQAQRRLQRKIFRSLSGAEVTQFEQLPPLSLSLHSDISSNLKSMAIAKPTKEELEKTNQKGFEAIISMNEFLDGPKSRSSELAYTWKIAMQFIRGFRKLHFVGPCVTVFGSARFQPGHEYYVMAEEIGKAIASTGFTVMTGGGPGIMEAANKGAMEAGGYSVGCNIRLPREQAPNSYMHEWVTIDYFFVRKVLLLKYSYAFIVLPGGWGTMDELFETLTLVQTGMIHHFPVVLMGKTYYQPLMDYLDFMLSKGTISADDLKLVKLTDDTHEAIDHVSKYVSEFYKIKKQRKGLLLLGERGRKRSDVLNAIKKK